LRRKRFVPKLTSFSQTGTMAEARSSCRRLLEPRVSPLSAFTQTARRTATVTNGIESDRHFESLDGRRVAKDAATDFTRYASDVETQKKQVAQLTTMVSELQTALDSRVVIERANGMLAERFDLPIQEAFELLRDAARDSRRQLRAIAVDVVDSGRRTPHEIANARGRDEPS
jgi:hypothetical protein